MSADRSDGFVERSEMVESNFAALLEMLASNFRFRAFVTALTLLSDGVL